ncbi:hypothetical protein BDY21DRAFT_201730 [Lineolata rhizophorae]|uniref:Uncharacterized protein n=1 Tax=Lineolata rhizophorae TaxID=578093 RepID=A0A6A6P5P2_9PEZI|nr:hypothetical protein BDY21DRAFT_201730 [Lineolata rhizophorae]
MIYIELLKLLGLSGALARAFYWSGLFLASSSATSRAKESHNGFASRHHMLIIGSWWESEMIKCSWLAKQCEGAQTVPASGGARSFVLSRVLNSRVRRCWHSSGHVAKKYDSTY